MDYSKLSKEELIALLHTGGTCLYESKSKSGTQTRCRNDGEKEYFGFCSRHKNTVQAKNAQKEHEEANSTVEEPEPEPEKIDKVEEEPAKDESSDEEVEEEEEEHKSITAKKNKWGYYEHKETKMCFDPSTKRVIGRINYKKGRLYALTEKDKEVCDEYGMVYSDSESDEE